MYVKDTKADGKRAGALLEVRNAAGTSTQYDGVCHNTLGYNKVAVCNLDFPESRVINFAAGTCDGDSATWACNSLFDWSLGSWRSSRT